MFQIEHYQKILEEQCLNSIRLTAPLYILLELGVLEHLVDGRFRVNIYTSKKALGHFVRGYLKTLHNMLLFEHLPFKIVST